MKKKRTNLYLDSRDVAKAKKKLAKAGMTLSFWVGQQLRALLQGKQP